VNDVSPLSVNPLEFVAKGNGTKPLPILSNVFKTNMWGIPINTFLYSLNCYLSNGMARFI